ncbi:MAG: Rrf2 family transcriptional regulator [Labilithrix sp.]|nr:Rrf2 family transcriptional regulator [Labilithrix sp.]
MKSDGRLSLVLHALLHMGDLDAAITSEDLAARMAIHPVVMRRTMAGLREAGIVRAQKGRGGGWEVARPLDEIRLDEVYAALGVTTLFAVGPRTKNPRCLVERAVNRAVDEALAHASDVFLAGLKRTSLADVRREVTHARPASCRSQRSSRGEQRHA